MASGQAVDQGQTKEPVARPNDILLDSKDSQLHV